MIALLLLLPAVVVLFLVWLGPFFGTTEQDEWCARTDLEVDERMRRQIGGWKW